MDIRKTKSYLAMGTLVFAGLAVGCDDTPSGIAEFSSSESSPLPPVYDHRRDEARTRVVVGEGEDNAVWPARAGEPAAVVFNGLDFDARGVAVSGTWQTPAGESITPRLPSVGFSDDEVCTFGSQDWGSLCIEGEAGAGCLRDGHWAELVRGGLTVGSEHKFVLTTAQAVADALPAGGDVGPLKSSMDDPLPLNANQVAAEVATLKLNLLFADAGLMGTYPLGEVVVVGGVFSGWSYSAVADYTSRLVGGEDYLADGLGMVGYNELLDELQALNAAGKDCRAAAYIRR